MKVDLQELPFDPWQYIHHYQQQADFAGQVGATSVFVGSMREINNGHNVSAMNLEHYPVMTRKHLESICTEALQQWPILDCLIVHRYGQINPDDTIVLIAVWSAHRAESFAACRYLIEELKQRAPFWKKETLIGGDGDYWVTQNTKT